MISTNTGSHVQLAPIGMPAMRPNEMLCRMPEV
jgi:hypothetical protein